METYICIHCKSPVLSTSYCQWYCPECVALVEVEVVTEPERAITEVEDEDET